MFSFTLVYCKSKTIKHIRLYTVSNIQPGNAGTSHNRHSEVPDGSTALSPFYYIIFNPAVQVHEDKHYIQLCGGQFVVKQK
jgi:hypothetical protein